MSQLQPNEPKMHGLTKDQWVDLYEAADWKKIVIQACYDIAACTDASPEDRVSAMDHAGRMFAFGIAPEHTWPGKKSFAEGLRDVQLSIAVGNPLPLDVEKRRYCHERMLGVRAVTGQVVQLLDQNQVVSDAMRLAGATPETPDAAQN